MPEKDERLRNPRLLEIFTAVMVRLLSGSRLSEKQASQIPAVALNAALEIQKRETPTSWDDAEHTRISQIRAIGRLGTGVRVVAHIAEFPPPRTFHVLEEQVVGTTLTLRSLDGELVGTLGIVGDESIARIEALRTTGLLEFLARPVTMPIDPSAGRSDFLLHVEDERRTTSALDAISATRTERRETELLLTELRSRGVSPLDFLQSEVEQGLGVVGLDGLPLLRQLLRFTVLQAISTGRIGHAPAKLHALIIGPPGQGKKLVGLAARMLNSSWQEASPAKISAAGLVGASSHTAQGWRSQPGIIPQADGGVLILQDAHAVQRSKVHQLAPILQELIEDGVVRDSVAAGVRREVLVGLIIDLNRLGQVSTATGSHSEAPILGIRPLLSRVDLVAEIAADPQRAWRTSADLYDTIGTKAGAIDAELWVRRARLVVAALRDRHSEIDLGPARTLMSAAHERIEKENAALIAAMPEASDIPMRLVVSFARFVVASARAHDRSVASEEDVQEALTYLALKLEHFKMLAPLADEGRPRSSLDRVESTLRERLGRREFGEEDLRRFYAEITGEVISDRTARRWIEDLGAKRVRKGRYVLSVDDSRDPNEGRVS